MKYEVEVHLINGGVLEVNPMTQAEVDDVYRVIGVRDRARLTFPTTDNTAYLVPANQINYITIREAA